VGLALRTGISFCDVSDRLLFLDVVADRYFCLGKSAEHAFRTMTRRHELNSQEMRALAGLLRSGILVETTGASVPSPFSPIGNPTASLLDLSLPHADLGQVAAALSALVATRLFLRFGRLQSVLHKLAAAKPPSTAMAPIVPEAMQAVAVAFERTARMVRSHDQCLPRSVALARRLAALGLSADLIIGVRLRPFAAHSWVQAGTWLVNDRIDTVRTYTPILSV
jgi:Transglutaminase-like superfamily